MMSSASLDQYVDGKVASGEFASREEFLLETARVYKGLEERHGELRTLISERQEEAERGDVAPLDIAAIKEELARELDEKGQPK